MNPEVTYRQVLRGDPCAYCGAPSEHVDHIQAARRNGDDAWSNLTAACRPCNQTKCTQGLLLFLLGEPEAVPMKRVNLELPEDLLARIDEAAGDVPRNRWIRRVIETALNGPSADALRAADRIIRSSSQAKRNVQPIPKEAKR